MENNKNVLITGSAGFIGKHAVEIFKDSGFRVIGVDIKPMADSEGYKHYCLDINSPFFEPLVILERYFSFCSSFVYV